MWLGNWDSWATSLFPPLRSQKRGRAPVSGPAQKLGRQEGSPITEGRQFQTFLMAEPFFQMQIYFPRTLSTNEWGRERLGQWPGLRAPWGRRARSLPARHHLRLWQWGLEGPARTPSTLALVRREWRPSSCGDSAGHRGKERVSLCGSQQALSGVKQLRLVTSFPGKQSA